MLVVRPLAVNDSGENRPRCDPVGLSVKWHDAVRTSVGRDDDGSTHRSNRIRRLPAQAGARAARAARAAPVCRVMRRRRSGGSPAANGCRRIWPIPSPCGRHCTAVTPRTTSSTKWAAGVTTGSAKQRRLGFPRAPPRTQACGGSSISGVSGPGRGPASEHLRSRERVGDPQRRRGAQGLDRDARAAENPGAADDFGISLDGWTGAPIKQAERLTHPTTIFTSERFAKTAASESLSGV